MLDRLTRAAYRAERLWDKVAGPDPADAALIEPYFGYATPQGRVLRGRVLASVPAQRDHSTASLLGNVKAMGRLFLSDEVRGVRVTAAGAAARSDEEGYVSLLVEGRGSPGWHEVPARIEGNEAAFALPVFTPSEEARRGVISDIDDTIMRTGAWSLRRNLWTTMTGNAATRVVFPDAAHLMKALGAGTPEVPVFYVSSSPWNLHAFLEQVFTRNDIPTGPVFLRDFGLERDKFIKGTHGGHKGGAIDTVLAANPGLSFVLVGDTGQHDAAVYRDAVTRHPGRIERVILRVAGEKMRPEVADAVKEIAALGVPAQAVDSYDDVIPTLRG